MMTSLLKTKVSLRSSGGDTATGKFFTHIAYFAAGILVACLWIHHTSQMLEQTQMSRALLPKPKEEIDDVSTAATDSNTSSRIRAKLAQLSSDAARSTGNKVPFDFNDYIPPPSQQDSPTLNANDGSALSKDLPSNVHEQKQRDFLQIAAQFGTDKVKGFQRLPDCVQKGMCSRPEAVNLGCKVTGHFYNTMYQRWLGPLSTDNVEPFQFLEIGYFNGRGFDAYTSFLPMAEKHSMEISCIEEGQQSEGKWPWGNFAIKNPRYQELLTANRLHCGDASSFDFLHQIWTTQMHRPDAPPLKVVIDDGSHVSNHMATSLFFWFPRLAPGGLLFIEDIEPQTSANAFRKNVLSQLMVDMHYCGLPEERGVNKLCFPTIQPLLKSISCEMHICVLERNDQPAVEYNQTASMPPVNALNSALCQG